MNTKQILKKQLEIIRPSKEELKAITSETKILIKEMDAKLKKQKIAAQIFVGGSVAKNTLIKKDKYDIDMFVRFDSKYKEKELSKLLKKILPKGVKRIHGSRDYYSLKAKQPGLEFEIIPSVKVKNAKEARNITDLSYFHVNYVNKNMSKIKALDDEIRLAKAFAYYQDCYGAESYINGFSGYAMELLVINYKSFMNFVKAMVKIDPKAVGKKPIIDITKLYKNKEEIMKEMNNSKLHGPIILIDPTFKERNALAALSGKTFAKFQVACKKFLKNPGKQFFELQDIEAKMEKKYGKNLKRIILTTNKQAGDIGGTKLKKFHYYLETQISKLYTIRDHHFMYDESKNQGTILIVVNPKKELFVCGPPIKMKLAVKKFKKAHQSTTIKNGRICFTQKLNIKLEDYIKSFSKDKNKKKIVSEMDISSIKLS